MLSKAGRYVLGHGPRNRLIVPVTTVIAIIAVGGIGYFVLRDPGPKPVPGAAPAASSTTLGVVAGAPAPPPVPLASEPQIVVVTATDNYPAGTRADAVAISQYPVAAPAGMRPANAIADAKQLAALGPAVAVGPLGSWCLSREVFCGEDSRFVDASTRMGV